MQACEQFKILLRKHQENFFLGVLSKNDEFYLEMSEQARVLLNKLGNFNPLPTHEIEVIMKSDED
jgi:hypothetical protein